MLSHNTWYGVKSVAVGLGCLTLFACDGEAPDKMVGGTAATTIKVPQALARTTTTVKDNLAAYITVGSNDPVKMSINGSQATATVPKHEGSAVYTIEINHIASGSGTIIPLLTASKTGTGGSVSFVESDYTYVHGDNDFYTNLRELEAGTNPLDSQSFPSNDNFETNETAATAYDLTSYRNTDLMAPGTLFDHPASTYSFNYYGAGFLLAPNDVDVFSTTVGSSVTEYLGVVDFFEPGNDLDTVKAKLDNIRVGVLYPDPDGGEHIPFQYIPSDDYCLDQETDHGLTVYRCFIYFEEVPQSGVFYPYVAFNNDSVVATDSVDYVMSWYTN